MLSQLTKTIKMALKSTEEERAILRARSAVQRFPVVEWRQRMEDLHRRSINMSRAVAGPEAWRESDCDGAGLLPMQDADDWNPATELYPTQPDWDAHSINEGRMSMPPSPGTPGQWSQGSGTPGQWGQGSGTPGQWSQDSLTPGSDVYLSAPRFVHDGARSSYDAPDGNEYFAHQRDQSDSPQGFGNFLDKANRAIARDQKHAPDPFLDGGALHAPSKPFGAHSRVSSVESIASIVDEKANSPLNKAIATVSMLSLI
jgi:alpha-1,3-glucan synthase